MINFFGFDLAAMGWKIASWGAWLVALAVGVILTWWLTNYFVYQRRFNVSCRIMSVRHGEFGKYFEDVGAFLNRKDGTKIFRLRKQKTEIPQPDFKYLIPARKGNMLFLKQTGLDVFEPVLPSEVFKLEANTSTTKLMTPELDFWRVVAGERAKLKYFKAGFWQSPLGGITIIASTGMMLFLLLYLVLRHSTSYISAMAQISENFLKSSENYIKAFQAVSSNAVEVISEAPH